MGVCAPEKVCPSHDALSLFNVNTAFSYDTASSGLFAPHMNLWSIYQVSINYNVLILPVLIVKSIAFQANLNIHKILHIKTSVPKPEQLARNRTWSEACLIQVRFYGNVGKTGHKQ